MCFDWSLLLGNSGRSTQTRQGPMLSSYSTVEHLGRSVDVGRAAEEQAMDVAGGFFVGWHCAEVVGGG